MMIRHPRAGREHTCLTCSGPIAVGEHHLVVRIAPHDFTPRREGEWSNQRHHTACRPDLPAPEPHGRRNPCVWERPGAEHVDDVLVAQIATGSRPVFSTRALTWGDRVAIAARLGTVNAVMRTFNCSGRTARRYLNAAGGIQPARPEREMST